MYTIKKYNKFVADFSAQAPEIIIFINDITYI